jgi:seryl-tRNA synthetase
MLDIKFIRENPDAVKNAAKNKRFDVDIDRLLQLDLRRRELIGETETARSRRNEVASLIPKASADDRPGLIEEGKALKDRVQEIEETLATVTLEYDNLLLMVPNVALDEVPVGLTDADNQVLRVVGEPKKFDFEAKDHEELGVSLGILDKERAIKFAGARSYLLRGAGALLEMAVVRLAMDILVESGFELVLGPLMVNESAMVGTGFFPYGKEDTYNLVKDEKYLIGTSEVFLVSMNANEIIDESRLPIRICGMSPCFRREAGSAGKDTRGVYRVHQFTKVEQVVICKNDPTESRMHHELILGNAEKLLQRLEIPYRVALACTGEIGLGQVLKHEVESWMPSREGYFETHSCSSLYEYQARRSQIRWRDSEGKIHFCYTLNNTMVASPRILIPLLENYQNADGSVTIPMALRPYMYGMERIEPVA